MPEYKPVDPDMHTQWTDKLAKLNLFIETYPKTYKEILGVIVPYVKAYTKLVIIKGGSNETDRIIEEAQNINYRIEPEWKKLHKEAISVYSFKKETIGAAITATAVATTFGSALVFVLVCGIAIKAAQQYGPTIIESVKMMVTNWRDRIRRALQKSQKSELTETKTNKKIPSESPKGKHLTSVLAGALGFLLGTKITPKVMTNIMWVAGLVALGAYLIYRKTK